MNSFADLMHRRRSCRKFTNEKIDADELSMVLNAALISPSAKNRRSWHFVAIAGRRLGVGQLLGAGAQSRTE